MTTYGNGSLGVLAVREDHVQQVVRQLVEVLQREDLEHQHVFRALVVADIAHYAHHGAGPLSHLLKAGNLLVL